MKKLYFIEHGYDRYHVSFLTGPFNLLRDCKKAYEKIKDDHKIKILYRLDEQEKIVIQRSSF